MMEFIVYRLENIVENGEDAGYRYISFFPTMFSKVLFPPRFLQRLYGNGCMHLIVHSGDAWQLNTDILQWSQITVPNDCPRLWHTCVCTKDKEILVFGGCCSNILDVQESVVCIVDFYYYAPLQGSGRILLCKCRSVRQSVGQ